jgi:hypothetical protein
MTIVFKRLTAFLEDEYFSTCLEDKQEWEFYDRATLKAVATSVPSFLTFAKRVRLDSEPDMETVLAKFTCSATVVDVLDRELGAYLSAISAAFPKVKDLIVP